MSWCWCWLLNVTDSSQSTWFHCHSNLYLNYFHFQFFSVNPTFFIIFILLFAHGRKHKWINRDYRHTENCEWSNLMETEIIEIEIILFYLTFLDIGHLCALREKNTISFRFFSYYLFATVSTLGKTRFLQNDESESIRICYWGRWCWVGSTPSAHTNIHSRCTPKNEALNLLPSIYYGFDYMIVIQHNHKLFKACRF